jgi:hypothetical protein
LGPTLFPLVAEQPGLSRSSGPAAIVSAGWNTTASAVVETRLDWLDKEKKR